MERAERNWRAGLVAVVVVLMAFALVATAALMTPMHAQAASKKKVWVITSKTEKEIQHYVSEGEPAQYVTTNSTKYSYNKNGLLVKTSRKGTNLLPLVNSWKYDSKGNYKKWTSKLKDKKWEKSTFSLKFDKKKRVKRIDSKQDGYTYENNCAYNGKGRCKKFGNDVKVSYTGKGYIKKIGNSVTTDKITRNAKGDMTKIKHAGYGSTTTAKIQNTYKSGRLASWTVTAKYAQDNLSETQGTFKWKKISVPKKLVKKVKAQQRWIADQLCADATVDIPLVVINK